MDYVCSVVFICQSFVLIILRRVNVSYTLLNLLTKAS
ncbi:hypothetical protein, partial [Escherichia coli]